MTSQWRDEALCRRFADLPWITDPQDRTLSEQRVMEVVCAACPVFDRCEAYADAHQVTSGFYAGRDWTPTLEEVEHPKEGHREEGHRKDGAA